MPDRIVSPAPRTGCTPRASARAGGFTLVEVLIALAVVTLISLVVLSALGPWLRLKQSVDNERKLQSVRASVTAYYRANAMALEAEKGARLGPFENVVPANGQCASAREAFAAVPQHLADGPDEAATDGYRNPLCVFVSRQLARNIDGRLLVYHVFAAVSPGPDGVLDATTTFDPDTGVLSLGEGEDTPSDDRAVLVNGYDVQLALYQETMARLARVVDAYETYFTARYLAWPDRDVTRYYFAASAGDPTYDKPLVSPATNQPVTVDATAEDWPPAETVLAPLGLSPESLRSAWEQENVIEVGVSDESVAGVTVKSPRTSGVGVLPYTALLRTRLPGTDSSGAPIWAVRVAVGHY